MVIALAGVLEHVLEMADQLAIRPGGNRGLMHVECTGKSRLNILQLQIGLVQKYGPVLLHQGQDLLFTTSNRGQGLVGHQQGTWICNIETIIQNPIRLHPDSKPA
jgi:hypothetical protein